MPAPAQPRSSRRPRRFRSVRPPRPSPADGARRHRDGHRLQGHERRLRRADVTLRSRTRARCASSRWPTRCTSRAMRSSGSPRACPHPAADKFVKAPVGSGPQHGSLLNAFLDEAFNGLTPSRLSDTVGSESVGGRRLGDHRAQGQAEGASLRVEGRRSRSSAYRLVDEPGQLASRGGTRTSGSGRRPTPGAPLGWPAWFAPLGGALRAAPSSSVCMRAGRRASAGRRGVGGARAVGARASGEDCGPNAATRRVAPDASVTPVCTFGVRGHGVLAGPQSALVHRAAAFVVGGTSGDRLVLAHRVGFGGPRAAGRSRRRIIAQRPWTPRAWPPISAERPRCRGARPPALPPWRRADALRASAWLGAASCAHRRGRARR